MKQYQNIFKSSKIMCIEYIQNIFSAPQPPSLLSQYWNNLKSIISVIKKSPITKIALTTLGIYQKIDVIASIYNWTHDEGTSGTKVLTGIDDLLCTEIALLATCHAVIKPTAQLVLESTGAVLLAYSTVNYFILKTERNPTAIFIENHITPRLHSLISQYS